MSLELGRPDAALWRRDARGPATEANWSGAPSFLRRPWSPGPEGARGADLAVVGAPFDLATSNRPGARLGPRALRAASTMVATWTRLPPWDFDPLLRAAVVDVGDMRLDYGRPESVPAALQAQAAAILAEGASLLALGGDHFVSLPLLRARAEREGRPLALVHFDAHSDTWRDEEGRIDHGTMFFHAAREGTVDPALSTQIGIRTPNPETHGFRVIGAREAKSRPPAEVAAEALERAGGAPAYLTFDIDCLDPAFAPGTGTPEVGGLSTFEAREMLFGLRGLNMVGGDLVEVAPAYDSAEATALAGATLAFDMIAVFAHRMPRHPREDERDARVAARLVAAGAAPPAAGDDSAGGSP